MKFNSIEEYEESLDKYPYLKEHNECPICDTFVNTGDPWEWGSGECPTCGNEWYWDELYTEDNYWPVIDWDCYTYNY